MKPTKMKPTTTAPPKLQVETSAKNETNHTNKIQTSKQGKEILLATNKPPQNPRQKQEQPVNTRKLKPPPTPTQENYQA